MSLAEKSALEVLRSAVAGLLVFDAGQRVLFWNRWMEQASGISAEDAEGKTFVELFPALENSMLHQAIVNTLKNRQSRIMNHTLHRRLFPLHGEGGEPLCQQLYILPLVEGEACCCMVQINDVTVAAKREKLLHEKEQHLRQINETLEQRVAAEVERNMNHERMMIHQGRLAAMGEMVHNIAHQWRQPLNVLALVLANIRDELDSGENNQAALDKLFLDAKKVIAKMSSTIDDFRDFFKPNREKSVFDVKAAVQDALRIVEVSFRQQRIDFTLEGPEGVLTFGYPNEFSQVLLNVLNNARDAIAGDASRKGEIHIIVKREEGWAVVCIADNGGGISAAVLPKIFDPYFTTKDKGSGIGLYMTRIIIEDHMNGRIEAANRGAGVEFTIRCPLTPDRRTAR